ncbi:unnamed protein product [Orchesella dallaii]|uniref:Methyltransferase domain-containing protein n=1 Tax=Orchesella dallaii TaxID=48710 RepID=A0ABP1S1B6_9HEXA
MEKSENLWFTERERLDELQKNKSATIKLIDMWKLFGSGYSCPFNLTREGNEGDGGKWICGLEKILSQKESCAIYSFGIANDSTFEAELLGRTKNCSLFAYDPSVSQIGWPLTASTPRVTFQQFGLSFRDDRRERTLKTLMNQNGHKWIDVLKVDIEGHEYESLFQAMNDFDGFPVGQLLVELHVTSKPFNVTVFFTLIQKLESFGMRVFNYEPNPLCKMCCEYSFLNKKLFI